MADVSDAEVARWIQTAGVEWKVEEIQRRAAAIRAVSKLISPDIVLDLVREIVGRKQRHPEALREYFRVLNEADPTMLAGQGHNIALTAGIALVAALRRGPSPASDLGALSMLSVTVDGRYCSDLGRPFVGEARQYLVSEGHNRRLRRDNSPIGPVSVVARPALTDNQAATVLTALNEILDGAQTAITTLTEELNQQTAEANRLGRIRDEESEMLWWVFLGASKSCGPFRALGVAATSVISGVELGEFTATVPGPVSATGLLQTVLDLAGDTTVPTSIVRGINACSRDWRRQFLERIKQPLQGVDDLCPLSLAIQKSLETAGAEDWIPVAKHLTGLAVDEPIPAIDVASQLYRETLLLRTLGKDQSIK
jgi:hypothetical protein